MHSFGVESDLEQALCSTRRKNYGASGCINPNVRECTSFDALKEQYIGHHEIIIQSLVRFEMIWLAICDFAISFPKSTLEGMTLIQRRGAAAASSIRCRVLWLHPRSQANIHPRWPVGDQLRSLLTRVHREGGGAAEAVAPGAREGVADRCRRLA